MVNGVNVDVVAVPGWSGRVTGKARGCDTALQLEHEQEGSRVQEKVVCP